MRSLLVFAFAAFTLGSLARGLLPLASAIDSERRELKRLTRLWLAMLILAAIIDMLGSAAIAGAMFCAVGFCISAVEYLR